MKEEVNAEDICPYMHLKSYSFDLERIFCVDVQHSLALSRDDILRGLLVVAAARSIDIYMRYGGTNHPVAVARQAYAIRKAHKLASTTLASYVAT